MGRKMRNEKDILKEKLKEKILKLLPEPGLVRTDIGGMTYSGIVETDKLHRCFYEPLILLVLQGRKHAIIGSEKFSYGDGQCLVTSVDLPNVSYISEASRQRPYVAVLLPIDRQIIAQLIPEVPPVKLDALSFKGLSVADADHYVYDAFLRLMDLVEHPQQKSVMAPMIIREIHYRLMLGPLGSQLRMMNTMGTQSNQIAQAVEWLKANFKELLKIDKLAVRVGMAPSTFRRHFKQVTTLSPLQYQKRLRLYEAQRLMLMEGHTATSACYEVGYESHTQFSREYKRMFGEPPHKDVRKIMAG